MSSEEEESAYSESESSAEEVDKGPTTAPEVPDPERPVLVMYRTTKKGVKKYKEEERSWLYFVAPVGPAEPVAVLRKENYEHPDTLYSIYSKEYYERIPIVPMRIQSLKYRNLKHTPICMRCFRYFGLYEDTERLIALANESSLAQGKNRLLSAEVTNKATATLSIDPEDKKKRFLEAAGLQPKQKKALQRPEDRYDMGRHICQQCRNVLKNAKKLILLKNMGTDKKHKDLSKTKKQKTLRAMFNRKAPKKEVEHAREQWQARIRGQSGALQAPLRVPKLRSAIFAVPKYDEMNEAVEQQEKNKMALDDLIKAKLKDAGLSAEQILVSGVEAFFLIKNKVTGQADLRPLRQSRFWILVNTFRRLNAETKLHEANLFRRALQDTFSDAGLIRAIKFNMLEDDRRFSKDTFKGHIIKARVQGGVEIGPTFSFLHAHIMLTIDHFSNITVALQRDTAVSQAYPEDCLEAQFNENYRRRFEEYGKNVIDMWTEEKESAEYELANNNKMNRDKRETLELLIADLELKIRDNPPERWHPRPAVLMFELIPEERYISKIQAYMVKTMPEAQRREMLKRAGNTEGQLANFVYSVLDERAAQGAHGEPQVSADSSGAFVMGAE